MPAAPEFTQAVGGIGVAEVLRQRKAEHLSQAHRHIAIAAEIVVDLQGVAQRAEPGQAHIPCPAGKDGVGNGADGVSQQQLLSKAPHEAEGPGFDLLRAAGTLIKLRGDFMVLHNRPGDQLREKGQIQQQLPEIPRPALRFTVDINHIGQALKGIKRDADGQQQSRRWQGKHAQDKVRVLINTEQPKIHHDGRRQNRPAFFPSPGQQASGQVVKQHRDEKKRQIAKLPEGVEHQARPGQQYVSRTGAGKQRMEQEHGRQKRKEENRRAENHDRTSIDLDYIIVSNPFIHCKSV